MDQQLCSHETDAIIFVLQTRLFAKNLWSLFNTVLCQDGLICDDVGNNIPGTPVYDALPDNKVVEDAVIPNYEDINNDIIIIDDDDRLASDIDPPQKQSSVN